MALPIQLQLFYNTQIPVFLWIITKNKQEKKFGNRTRETLFICADSLGKMSDHTHRILTDEDINRT